MDSAMRKFASATMNVNEFREIFVQMKCDAAQCEFLSVVVGMTDIVVCNVMQITLCFR